MFGVFFMEWVYIGMWHVCFFLWEGVYYLWTIDKLISFTSNKVTELQNIHWYRYKPSNNSSQCSILLCFYKQLLKIFWFQTDPTVRPYSICRTVRPCGVVRSVNRQMSQYERNQCSERALKSESNSILTICKINKEALVTLYALFDW